MIPPRGILGMPRYEHEAIIQIGNMLAIKGADAPYSRCIFTLNSCSPINGAEVKSFATESEMLLAWKKFVIESDPDIITGHNIGRFDFPQLILRAAVLELDKFSCQDVYATVEKLPVNQRVWSGAPVLAGRLQLDTNLYMETLQSRRVLGKSNTLNSVATEYLGDKKEGVSYLMINDLQMGGPQQRKRLAVYCLKDTYLPIQLLESSSLRCLERSIDAARKSERFMYLPLQLTRIPETEGLGWAHHVLR
ncbi:ribonuclease H-like domain-containing protein [Mycena vitilis]|nr:ribonuclease H-like domain-containing protein [Mycena vitilis]